MHAPRLTELAAAAALALFFLLGAARLGSADLAGRLDLPADSADRMTVVAVLQAEDCEGTVDFLRAFRSEVLSRDYRIVALVAGSAGETRDVEARLEDRVGPVPVRRADGRRVRALRTLGHDRTPFILVLDRSGRVRFSSPGDDFFERPDPVLAVLGRIAALAAAHPQAPTAEEP